jgi:hypothetical protein
MVIEINFLSSGQSTVRGCSDPTFSWGFEVRKNLISFYVRTFSPVGSFPTNKPLQSQ